MTGQLPRRTLGHTGIPVSALALGGHEYLADGRLKGFGDDFENAVLAGYRRSDFGGPARRAIVARALARGVNYFDVTIDPEVEALGRTLRSPAQSRFTMTRRTCGQTSTRPSFPEPWVRAFRAARPCRPA